MSVISGPAPPMATSTPAVLFAAQTLSGFAKNQRSALGITGLQPEILETFLHVCHSTHQESLAQPRRRPEVHTAAIRPVISRLPSRQPYSIRACACGSSAARVASAPDAPKCSGRPEASGEPCAFCTLNDEQVSDALARFVGHAVSATQGESGVCF